MEGPQAVLNIPAEAEDSQPLSSHPSPQPPQPFPGTAAPCGAALRLGKSGIPRATWGSAWSLIPSPGNLLLAPRSSGVTHVPSPAPGDALLPWAGAEPQQRRVGTPAGERPGDPPPPPLPRPPGPGEVGRALGKCVCPAWHQGDGHGLRCCRQRAQGRGNKGFAAALPREGTRSGSVRGRSSPAGGCIG